MHMQMHMQMQMHMHMAASQAALTLEGCSPVRQPCAPSDPATACARGCNPTRPVAAQAALDEASRGLLSSFWQEWAHIESQVRLGLGLG